MVGYVEVVLRLLVIGSPFGSVSEREATGGVSYAWDEVFTSSSRNDKTDTSSHSRRRSW